MTAPLSLFDYRQKARRPISTLAPLSDDDKMRLSTQVARVRVLMCDGEWRTLRVIASMIGASEAGVSARLRDLRKKQYGSLVVERRKCSEHLYEYRVSQPTT